MFCNGMNCYSNVFSDANEWSAWSDSPSGARCLGVRVRECLNPLVMNNPSSNCDGDSVQNITYGEFSSMTH